MPANDQLPLSDQWLVQGDLFYRLEGVDNGDEEEADFVVVDVPRTLDDRENGRQFVPLKVSGAKGRRRVRAEHPCWVTRSSPAETMPAEYLWSCLDEQETQPPQTTGVMTFIALLVQCLTMEQKYPSLQIIIAELPVQTAGNSSN